MPDRPNLLYIHSDQHNPFVMGCAGDPVVATPHLDALAARGVLCTGVYCPSPVCVASRMAMLAGRYPHEIDVWANSPSLDSGVPTIAHAVAAAGLRPVLAGRMHSIGPDQLHGYVERPIGDHSARRHDYERYAGRVPPPRVRVPFGDALHPFDRWWREHARLTATPEDCALRARTAYWALVDRMDHLIGQILTALEANGLTEDTLVVYTSDHGDMAGERELWMKRCCYEPSARVPAILAWPGVLPEGARCDRVLSALDLHATMLAAQGAAPLPGARGRDTLPLLRSGPDSSERIDWEDEAFCEYAIQEGWVQRMVRHGHWKLIHHDGQPPQLFDLQGDPDELRDRAADPDCADTVAALTERVAADGWDPAHIRRRLVERQAEVEILRAAAKALPPNEPHRWPMDPAWTFAESERSAQSR